MSEIAALAEVTGKEILHDMQTSIGDDWSSLTDAQKQSIKRVAERAVEIPLRMKLTSDPAVKANLEAQLEATLSSVADWKTWGELALEDAFWKGVQKVASTLGSFLMGAALKFATGGAL